jgi:hypothetical protein
MQVVFDWRDEREGRVIEMVEGIAGGSVGWRAGAR